MSATRTCPSTSSSSSSGVSRTLLASFRILARTALAAALMALAATTAPRLAKVPVPQWNSAVSPVTRRTSRGLTPSWSATIWAKEVKCPCPCVPTPVATLTWPLGLDGHARALVGADARRLDKGHDAQAHVFALGAQARLLLLDELFVADHGRRLFQRGRIVAAVEDQRRKGLVDDLVLVGEGIGRDQVLLADLHPVDAQLFGRHVQQPLGQKDALRPAGPAHRRDDGLVGEHHLEIRVVVGHVVGAHGVALGVQRDGQAVGIVGARVVEELVLDAQDAPILASGPSRHSGPGPAPGWWRKSSPAGPRST